MGEINENLNGFMISYVHDTDNSQNKIKDPKELQEYLIKYLLDKGCVSVKRFIDSSSILFKSKMEFDLWNAHIDADYRGIMYYVFVEIKKRDTKMGERQIGEYRIESNRNPNIEEEFDLLVEKIRNK